MVIIDQQQVSAWVVSAHEPVGCQVILSANQLVCQAERLTNPSIHLATLRTIVLAQERGMAWAWLSNLLSQCLCARPIIASRSCLCMAKEISRLIIWCMNEIFGQQCRLMKNCSFWFFFFLWFQEKLGFNLFKGFKQLFITGKSCSNACAMQIWIFMQFFVSFWSGLCVRHDTWSLIDCLKMNLFKM